MPSGADELVLVGDPDQSIYAFRGADETALRDVDERFGVAGARVPIVALHTCRRFGPALVEATRRVAARLPGRAEQRAIEAAAGTPGGRVEAAVFRTASEEAAYIAGVLRGAHLDGLPWSQMAVLVRSTSHALGTLRRAMITAGVPVAVRGEDIPLAEQPAVQLMLALLRCALEPSALTDDLAETLLTGPLGGGDSIYLRRLRRLLRRQFPDDAGALAPLLRDRLGCEQLPAAERGPALRVARTLAAGAAAAAAGEDTETVLWAIWSATALAERWEAASRAGGGAGSAADRDLDSMLQLFAEAANFTDRLPNAKPGLFAEHVRRPADPGRGDGCGGRVRARRGRDPHRARKQGAGVGARLRRERAGGQLAGSAPARLAARRRGAGRRRPRHRRRRRRVARAAARRGAPAVLRRERRAPGRQLVVTAVAGGDEQPSRFLDELDPVDGDRPLAAPRPGRPPARAGRRTARGRVRRRRTRRRAAGRGGRARPARHGGCARGRPRRLVGAAAAEHHGRRGRSGSPGAGEPVAASSRSSAANCARSWRELGVQDEPSRGATFGTLVHKLASSAPDDQSLAEFERQLDEEWGSIDFGASWFADNERARATTMLERLVGWLRDSRA